LRLIIEENGSATFLLRRPCGNCKYDPQSMAPWLIYVFQIQKRILVGSSEKALSDIYRIATGFILLIKYA